MLSFSLAFVHTSSHCLGSISQYRGIKFWGCWYLAHRNTRGQGILLFLVAAAAD